MSPNLKKFAVSVVSGAVLLTAIASPASAGGNTLSCKYGTKYIPAVGYACKSYWEYLREQAAAGAQTAARQVQQTAKRFQEPYQDVYLSNGSCLSAGRTDCYRSK